MQSRTLFLICAAWLPQNAYALSRSIFQTSLATNDSLLSHWSPVDPAAFSLVVPELKLLICAVPKNACTQFNLATKAITGRGDTSFKHLRPRHDINEIFKDQSWTKAVFLRDPLERLVSGYRSKCEPPMEGNGFNCMNFEDSTPKSWPSFDKFASELHRCHNPHFDPQVSFCFLNRSIDSYNFVGRITKDYRAVATEAKQLFKQAAVRSGTMTDTNRHFLTEVCEKHFPPDGFSKGNLNHFHNDTDVRAYYKKGTTLDAALQRYIVDYDRLPLKPPAWVSKGRLIRARHAALAALPKLGEENPRFSCRSPR